MSTKRDHLARACKDKSKDTSQKKVDVGLLPSARRPSTATGDRGAGGNTTNQKVYAARKRLARIIGLPVHHPSFGTPFNMKRIGKIERALEKKKKLNLKPVKVKELGQPSGAIKTGEGGPGTRTRGRRAEAKEEEKQNTSKDK